MDHDITDDVMSEREEFVEHEERAGIRDAGRGNGADTHVDVALVQHLTDLGNAKRFVLHHGKNVRYIPARGGWFFWDHRRWRLDDSGEIERYAKQTAATIWDEVQLVADTDEKKRTAMWAHKSEGVARLEAMLRLAQSEGEVVAHVEELDAHPFLFNVLNGSIDLRTGRLRPHRRQDLLTALAPIEYDPAATCPTWLAFLDRILGGDAQLIAFVQRALGYALTGDTSEQVLFLFYGPGANGKSTLVEAVRGVFGDYAQQADFVTFLSLRDDGRPRNDIARLVGARFVAAIEVESGKRLNESLVKQLTGSDTITARYLYREFFEFVPQFKIFLAANHKPAIREMNTAMWRRVRLVPFTVTIPPNERDRTLPAKLRAEQRGILAWAVQGCLNWQQHGLGEPEAVQKATGAYKEEMDTLGAFIRECCVIDQNAHVGAEALYKEFRDWCDRNGERHGTQSKFRQHLLERGLQQIKHNSGMRWTGIGLATEVQGAA
jgi:putative DNA primase/helicase